MANKSDFMASAEWMDKGESRFFKHHYKSQFKNLGPMVRE
jgi:hypothetical protein